MIVTRKYYSPIFVTIFYSPDGMWVDKVKTIANKKGYSLKDIASLIEMSEANLYKCFKRGSIETKHLIKLANTLGVATSYFFDEEGDPGHKAHAIGDQSVAVAGKDIFISQGEEKGRHTTGGGEGSAINEKVKMLEQLLAEKDRVIEEKEKLIEQKEKLIEEKERLIKILMEKR